MEGLNNNKPEKKSPDAQAILDQLRRRGLKVTNLDLEENTVTLIGGDEKEHVKDLNEVIEAGKSAEEAAKRNEKLTIHPDGTVGEEWGDQDFKEYEDRTE